MTPIERVHLGDQIYLYTGEGMMPPNEDMDERHWRMIWAVGFDDQLQVGQNVFFPLYVTLPHSQITTPLTREDRMQHLEKVARDFIKLAKKVELFND